MTSSMKQTMQEAMRLMRSGDLHAATRAIQDGLRARAGSDGASSAAADYPSAANEDCIEGRYEVVIPASPDATLPDAGGADSHAGSERDRGDDGCATLGDVRDANVDEAPVEAPQYPSDGAFTDHHFTCGAGAINYKLFVPAGVCASAPLILMLHGCTQSPDDFARGTRMNALAREHGYVVAYPAQTQRKNMSKCWNWFRSQDQQRDQGEPALLATLTRHLVKTHGLDERRVYVAGLSAGGAMAAVLASTYPDIYAAIGVHSGLRTGAAHDMPSAFTAMRQGAGPLAPRDSLAQTDRVPAIVFHGDRDGTVDPRNGDDVVAQSVGNLASMQDAASNASRVTVQRGSAPGGRSYTCTVYRDSEGRAVAEQWIVHGAGHAWSGGDPSGSYTDPAGPDASKQMLRFFSGFTRSMIH